MDLTGCCGYNREAKKITFIGIFTFSIPALMFGGAGFLALSIIGFFNHEIKYKNKKLTAFLNANNKIINTSLNPKIRCSVAARLFKLSPRLSGITYKYFNSTILTLLWVGIILLLIKFV